MNATDPERNVAGQSHELGARRADWDWFGHISNVRLPTYGVEVQLAVGPRPVTYNGGASSYCLFDGGLKMEIDKIVQMIGSFN